MAEQKGRCLCGMVKFTVSGLGNNVGACHCGMCRKWGGGPLMALDSGTKIAFSGEKNITVYDSSDWAERGFCKKCGSHLFYRLKETNEYTLPAGLFDNQENFKFDLQIYTDRKPAFYSFANKTSEMTEAEVIEKYAPEN